MSSDPIILYDGLCPMCNGVVKSILRFDKKRQFYFTALQSERALAILADAGVKTDNSTIVLWHNNQVFLRSQAVFKIAEFLGFPWSVLRLGRILPAKLTDGLYDYIAQRRFSWAGKYDSCPMPPEKWRTRFI
jgi:predicted DCC family thiol-disulfide oxidoreductase YuxK